MSGLIGNGILISDRTPAPSPGGGSKDWLMNNQADPEYIKNRPYYTTTLAALMAQIAANSLRLDAGYLITDADPTVANSGIIVRATGPDRVSRQAVFLANYSGTIHSEFCMYDLANNKVKMRIDIYGNTVIDSTATHGTLQWFPWGNPNVTGNTVTDTTGVVSIGSCEFRNNIIEAGQLNIDSPTKINNNFITGPCIININNGCSLLGNTLNYINTLTLQNNNTMFGCRLQGAGVNITLANNAILANSEITGSSEFTVPSGRTLIGQFHNLKDTDLSRYAIGTFNNATYIGNVNSNFEITIDLGGTSSFSDTTINAPGVVICSNAYHATVDDVVLGNITTPVIFRYNGIADFTIDSGNPGQFKIDTNIKINTLLGSGIIKMDNTKGCYFIARWSQSQSAWIIESFYSL